MSGEFFRLAWLVQGNQIMGFENRNLSLGAMRAFCIAAERESFREAAEAMFLTSSAVSHKIKQLETALGAKLFERTPRSLSLTEFGRSFYEDTRPLLEHFDTVAAKHTQTGQARSLRISVQPFFASELFVPRLSEFVAKHPDIDISIDTSDESPQKHPGIADASIRIFKSPPESLAHDLLFPLRLTPAASPGFFERVKVRSGRIVGEFPLVVHESRPKAWQKWERESQIKIPSHSNSIRLDSMIAVARAAERGLGAALVPKKLSEAWFDSCSLVQLFDHELVTNDAYYLVSRNEDEKKEDVKLFRQWALQNFADGR